MKPLFVTSIIAISAVSMIGCHSTELDENSRVSQLIRELETTPWQGPSNIANPTLWIFNFTEPMQKIIEIGPSAQDELIDELDNPKIRDQVIILLGAIGDEKAVPHIIDAMSDDYSLLNKYANLALTNITVADVIWHHGGGTLVGEPSNPKKLWADWWEKNKDNFSVKPLKQAEDIQIIQITVFIKEKNKNARRYSR